MLDHLCIDGRLLFASGIGTYLRHIIGSLPAKKITLLARKEDRERLALFPHVAPLFISAPLYSVQEQFSFVCKIPPCSVFWSPHYNVPLLPIRAKKRIVTIHDTAHLAFSSSQTWVQNRYARLFLQQAVARSDIVITVSSFSEKEIRSRLHVQKENIYTIPNGVDYDFFSREGTKEEILSLEEKYNLPEKFLLFVGNCKPHKNLLLLFKLYQQGLCHLPLVVVGKKEGFLSKEPLVAKIENSPSMRKKISFTGEVLTSELPLFYQRAEMLVFPSLYEGFGLPVLEAMSARCPVIASFAASMPEVCSNAAHLIDPHDVRSLARGIDRILSSSLYRDDLIIKGQRRAQEFSWKKTASEHSNLFLNQSLA